MLTHVSPCITTSSMVASPMSPEGVLLSVEVLCWHYEKHAILTGVTVVTVVIVMTLVTVVKIVTVVTVVTKRICSFFFFFFFFIL